MCKVATVIYKGSIKRLVQKITFSVSLHLFWNVPNLLTWVCFCSFVCICYSAKQHVAIEKRGGKKEFERLKYLNLVKISVGNTLIHVQWLQRLVSIVTSSAHCTALAHMWSRKRHSSVCSAEKYGHLATHTETLEIRWWEWGLEDCLPSLLFGCISFLYLERSFILSPEVTSPKWEVHEPIWTLC